MGAKTEIQDVKALRALYLEHIDEAIKEAMNASNDRILRVLKDARILVVAGCHPTTALKAIQGGTTPPVEIFGNVE